MNLRARLASTSIVMALGSMASLAAQALLGLAMLHYFTPQAAGRFAVVAQIAFFWVTLALAQAPLQLLADAHRPPGEALHTALRSSAWRWLGLLPLVLVAIWLSAIEQPVIAAAWAALMALLQLAWYLAQPWTLRTGSSASAALVRCAPPVIALVLSVAAALAWPSSQGSSANSLLVAASSGYAIGALWLLSALRPQPRHTTHITTAPANTTAAVHQGDRRSTSLRLAHTAMDAIAGTALLLVWQRLHGVAETSYLAMLLRLLGFIPAIVHTAWTQVLLAHVRTARWQSLAVGASAAAAAALAGVMGALLLQTTSLAAAWGGMLPYVLPLVLWQGSACISAAVSHRPFQHGRESHYSWFAMTLQGLQLIVLLLPALHMVNWPPLTHLWWLAGTSCAGLLALTAWMLNLRSR